jgi:hypothetical protein
LISTKQHKKELIWVSNTYYTIDQKMIQMPARPNMGARMAKVQGLRVIWIMLVLFCDYSIFKQARGMRA